MLSWKDLNSAELGNVRVSRNATTVVMASGEVQTNEEATVYVNDFDLLVTVHFLEDTPLVLSLGQLCEDNGSSHEWTGGQHPRLIKKRQTCSKRHGELRAYCRPGLINRVFKKHISKIERRKATWCQTLPRGG